MNKTLADILRSYIPDGDGYNSEYAHNLNAAADALESQQSAPAGYVMVPVEPTPEMLLAGGHVNSEWLNDNAPIGESRYVTPMLDVYRSMLAAAPQPVALVCDECGGNGAGGDHEEDCSKAPQPVAQDGWIPISERLPDPGDCWVLVYADGAMNCMAWHDGAWHDWTNAQAHNIFPDEITHWMPLPSAPEVKP